MALFFRPPTTDLFPFDDLFGTSQAVLSRPDLRHGHEYHQKPYRIIDNNDTDKAVSLVLDLPGVRHSDLTVEIDDGTLKIKGTRTVFGSSKTQPFQHSVALHRARFDLDNICANLRDGVLVVTIPKTNHQDQEQQQKEQQRTAKLEVAVTQKDHDDWTNSSSTDDNTDKKAETFVVEVPGVKPADLRVEIENDVLTVVGVRKAAGTTARIVRRYKLDSDQLNTSAATANLADGLVVVAIPVREKEPLKTVVVTQNEQ